MSFLLIGSPNWEQGTYVRFILCLSILKPKVTYTVPIRTNNILCRFNHNSKQKGKDQGTDLPKLVHWKKISWYYEILL